MELDSEDELLLVSILVLQKKKRSICVEGIFKNRDLWRLPYLISKYDVS